MTQLEYTSLRLQKAMQLLQFALYRATEKGISVGNSEFVSQTRAFLGESPMPPDGR